jgi:hypothetical protein
MLGIEKDKFIEIMNRVQEQRENEMHKAIIQATQDNKIYDALHKPDE